ncbi:MAG: PASTA domain-containing protein, partial [Actinomycetota bacterium]
VRDEPTQLLEGGSTRAAATAVATGPAHPVTAELSAVESPGPEDDGTRYDASPVPVAERPARRSPWTWLLPLLLVLLLLAGLVWFFLLRDPAPVGQDPSPTGTVSSSSATAAQTVEVLAARYEGRPVDDVVQELSDLGFAVQREGRTSDQEVNTVLSLNPVGEVARSTTITVFYSTGPDTVELPSGMVGQQAQPLIDRIRLLGVNITLREEFSEDAEPGTVLRTQPVGGSTVRPGDTIEMWVVATPAPTPTPTPAAPAAGTPAPTTGSPSPTATPTGSGQGD